MDDNMRNLLREISQLLQVEIFDVKKMILLQMNPVLKLCKPFQLKDLIHHKTLIRSILTLLGAKVFQYEGKQAIPIAAVSELIHISFLFHNSLCNQVDDPILNDETVILIGDFLSSRAIEMIVDIKLNLITRILSDTFNTMSEGQIIKSFHINNPEITEDIYLNIIKRNHVCLFSACAQLGSILSDKQDKEKEIMRQFGEHLGISYYLMHDYQNYLNYTAHSKLSFPFIYALNHASSQKSKIISDMINNFKNVRPTKNDLKLMKTAVDETNALRYTVHLVKHHIQSAIDCLQAIPANSYRNILIDFTHSIDQFV